MAFIKSRLLQPMLCAWLANALLLLLLVVVVVDYVQATPMVYKKNTQDKYEADLVAVSSTVIPLTVLEVSYGSGGKPSEEYKMAYLKKLRKKVTQHGAHKTDDANAAKPAALITVKTKHQQ